MPNTAKKISFSLLAALILSAIVYFLYPELTRLWQSVEIQELHPAGLLAAYAVLPVLGFPILPLLILLGIRFGSVYGSLAAVVIMPVHMVISFYITKIWLFRLVKWIAHKRAVEIPKVPADHQLKFGFMFMIVPGLSYALKNYLLPLSGIGFLNFLLCGWLSHAASAVFFVILGDGASQWAIPVLTGMLVVLMLFFAVRKKILSLYNTF